MWWGVFHLQASLSISASQRSKSPLLEPWIFCVLSWHCYRLSCPLWSRSLMFFSRSQLIADNWMFQPHSQCVPAWRAGGLAHEDEDNLDHLVSWVIRVMLLELKVNLSFGLCRMVIEVFQRSRSWGYFSVNQEIILHHFPSSGTASHLHAAWHIKNCCCSNQKHK